MFENITSDIVIHECEKKECTPAQKKTLTSLTFRFDSGMRDAWKSIYSINPYRQYNITKHKIHMAYFQGKIIGWALSFFEEGHRSPRAMFYVAKKFRRQGVGTFLLDTIRKNYGRDPFVFWSENDGFFSANGINSKRIL